MCLCYDSENSNFIIYYSIYGHVLGLSARSYTYISWCAYLYYNANFYDIYNTTRQYFMTMLNHLYDSINIAVKYTVIKKYTDEINFFLL